MGKLGVRGGLDCGGWLRWSSCFMRVIWFVVGGMSVVFVVRLGGERKVKGGKE